MKNTTIQMALLSEVRTPAQAYHFALARKKTTKTKKKS